MNDQKLRGAMGLAMRAGKCVSGDFAVEKAVKSGGAMLVLLDSGASQNTRKKCRDMCAHHGINCIELANMAASIGKHGRMVAAITDGNFANMIQLAHASLDAEGNAKE